jgi:hypothetical protein
MRYNGDLSRAEFPQIIRISARERIVKDQWCHAIADADIAPITLLQVKNYTTNYPERNRQAMRLISRRKAIQSSIAAGIGATGFSNVFTKPLWAESIVTFPGIQLYTVDKELKADASSTLLSLQKIGYREVEGAGFAGLTPKQFRVALNNAGLKCNSTHFFNFGDEDPNLLFEQANLLGVHYTVSSLMNKFSRKPAGGEMNFDDYKAMAENGVTTSFWERKMKSWAKSNSTVAG